MVAQNTQKLVIFRHFKFRLEQIPAVEQIPAQDQKRPSRNLPEFRNLASRANPHHCKKQIPGFSTIL